MTAEPFPSLVRALAAGDVRFVLIGVAGANYYAQSRGMLFVTQDRDLLLPPDPENELRAWRVCRSARLELSCGLEHLGTALVRAESGEFRIDLSLVMAGFEFDEVWRERRLFKDEGVEIPVARLEHIVASKAAAGRPKDRLFLATHEEARRELGARRRRGGDHETS